MRDDITRMAREAGWDMDDTVDGFSVRLERFFNLAYAAGASAEREACAEVADEWQLGVDDPRYQKSCADAIRARGNT